MPDINAEELLRQDQRLFAAKLSLDSLRQRIAEEVFPERANFTLTRVDGDEYMRNMYESVPAYNRRTLADAIGALVRPKQQQWSKIRPDNELYHEDENLAWCDWATAQQHKLIYHRRSNFHRAMRMGDHDIVTFGDGVLSVGEAADRSGRQLFDWHHLRDCAWTRNREHQVERVHRKWMIQLGDFARRWGADKLPPAAQKTLEKAPWEEIEVRHICMPADQYEGYGKKPAGKDFVSIYLCQESRKILKDDGGYWEFPYIVRPWESVDYSAYAYSPAAMLGLCDARLLQSQAAVLLEVGERAVNPPLIATKEAILGPINNYPGSVSFVDAEYDERLGAALRPLETTGDMRIGLEFKVDTREVLAAAWYLNKLNLPSDKDMTAYEVGERVSEYIRSIGPVIEPFEEHNKDVLDVSFKMMLRVTMEMNKSGAPGPLGWLEDMPQGLRGVDIDFELEGPVRAAYRRQKTVKAGEAVQMSGNFAQVYGPQVVDNIDADKLFRDGIDGIGGEHSWLKPIEIVQQKRRADAQAAEVEAQNAKIAQQVAMAKDAAGVVPAVAAANMAMPDALAQDGGDDAEAEFMELPEGMMDEEATPLVPA